MANESAPYAPPDPTNPQARRPLEPGEAEMGAKQLEAWNWAKAHASGDPGNQQILASQYLYKKYGILPNNGQGDWQNTGGGAHGWQIVNGDLVPKDRSWFEKYGGLAIAAGVLSAGTASAFLGGGAAAGGGLGGVESGATSGLGAASLPGAGTAVGGAAGLGGVEGGAAAGLGAGALPGAGTALGGAGGAGAWDAAGNFIGDSTVSTSDGSGGILGTASKYAGLGSDILGTVGAIGQSLGAAGKGAADARTQEALMNQRQDALSLNRYTDQLQGANTDLAQKRFQLQAPGERESNAVRGDILSNAKDFSYGAPTMVGNIPVPTSTGGLRPSIFSNDTRQLGATIARQSNQAQQSGDVFDPLPKIPNLTPLPSAGPADSILNTAGTVGNLATLLSKIPYGKIIGAFGG